MAVRDPGQPVLMRVKPAQVLAAIAAGVMMGGCAQLGGESGPVMLLALEGEASQTDAPPDDPQKAVEHWGAADSKNPRELDNAISYAKSLKATGQKAQALAVLQQA